jgi:multisubunit Na+/H+ antiporter MnhC subunit
MVTAAEGSRKRHEGQAFSSKMHAALFGVLTAFQAVLYCIEISSAPFVQWLMFTAVVFSLSMAVLSLWSVRVNKKWAMDAAADFRRTAAIHELWTNGHIEDWELGDMLSGDLPVPIISAKLP